MNHHHHRPARLAVSRAGGTVCVAGELDVATASVLAGALADEAVHLVEMAGVTFVDAAGVAVLVEADRVRRGDRRLTLVAPSVSVRRLLALVDVELAVHTG